MYSFPNLGPVHCSMSSSNCCFLTCIQVYQEAGKLVWYSHLFKNFPQFVVIHTIKGFDIVNKAGLIRSLGSLRRRNRSGALEEEKRRNFFFAYIPST